MTTSRPTISVTDPVSRAIDHTKRVLFRPFDLTKWFVIGFCAWLAGLGERGASFNFPGGGQGGHGGGNVQHELEQGREYVMSNLHWIVPVVVSVVILLLALWVLVLWLSSRGKFMLLHCVALNRGEVGVPWHKYAAEANSLLWFRLALMAIGTVIVLPIVVVIGLILFNMGVHDHWNFAGIAIVAGLFLSLILAGIVMGLVHKFTGDFVVPIMYQRRKRCLEAWAVFRGLLAANVGRLVVYLLFQIVIGLAIAAMVLTLVLMTCCVAGCFLAIPYLGTVLLLPVPVFLRAYSLYYLAQYGPEYDVFPPDAPPTHA